MAVPGLSAGGSRIQDLRSSGPALLTAPPAILARDATPARFGPTAPLAPGTPGMVWHPPHGWDAMNCCHSAAGLPGATSGPAAAAAGWPSWVGVPPDLPLVKAGLAEKSQAELPITSTRASTPAQSPADLGNG